MLFVILKFLWSYLCFDRSENKRPELFISHRSLHETASGAAMSRRTRRWILRVLLCLGIVYLKIGWAAFIWLLTLKVIIWHDQQKKTWELQLDFYLLLVLQRRLLCPACAHRQAADFSKRLIKHLGKSVNLSLTRASCVLITSWCFVRYDLPLNTRLLVKTFTGKIK